MSVIDTNLPASASYLSQRQELLAGSLARLSTVGTIVSQPDDPAAPLASDSLAAQARQALAGTAGVQNAVSYLQAADGFMSGVEKTLTRMGELAGQANDSASTPGDATSAQTEFQSLQDQLRASLSVGAGSAFFDADASGSALSVPRPDLHQTAIQGIVSQQNSGAYDLNLTSPTAGAQISDALQEVAAQRVTLGAANSRLQLAAATRATGQANLEAVSSGPADAAAAAALSQLARSNFLSQSGTALQAQANLDPSAVLRLI